VTVGSAAAARGRLRLPLPLLLPLLLLSGLTACTPAEVSRESGTVGEAPSLVGEPGCFFAGDVQDFRAIDRSTLLVFAPGRRNAFRVTVSPPSFRLRNANAVAFVGSSRICGQAGERLVVDGGIDRESLAVVDVRRLDGAALEAALAPRGSTVPAPRPGPGAGIEAGTEETPADDPPAGPAGTPGAP
jgi:hypothetical protein